VPRQFLPTVILLTALAGLGVAPSAAQQILKREPPLGQLREGETVLVDDGSCGPGKIKQVIGGNHIKVGGNKQIERTRRCIDRK
jgi:uncharacterized protein DUF6719